MAAVGFLSRYLNGPLPYVQRHITVTKFVEYVVNKNTSFLAPVLRMKLKAKRNASRVKKHRKGTGGGFPISDIDGTSEGFYKLIPAEFQELGSPFDDNSPANMETAHANSATERFYS